MSDATVYLLYEDCLHKTQYCDLWQPIENIARSSSTISEQDVHQNCIGCSQFLINDDIEYVQFQVIQNDT